MACAENMPAGNDSEMEEGEIVDDYDELSDISSEEEFLLRQRLQVLENYNNVLERKKAKDSSFGPGKRKEDNFLHNLSDISATDFDDNLNHVAAKNHITVNKDLREPKHKFHHKQKKKKDVEGNSIGRTKEYKKKVQHKKRLGMKIISESSEESDDEYRNKRRKLADAVVVNKNKNDKSSLHDRLQKMLSVSKPQECQKTVTTEDKQTETEITPAVKDKSCSPCLPVISNEQTAINKSQIEQNIVHNAPDLINLCTDDDNSSSNIIQISRDTIDAVVKEKDPAENEKNKERDSDDDLELLRQLALKTKTFKTKPEQQILTSETVKPLQLSEDEDSDTAELRLICLKSALLKKAIEMKQKQKLKKRLSQSSIMQNDFFEKDELLNRIHSENNTDIESVDMDMGSDVEERDKEIANEYDKDVVKQPENNCIKTDVHTQNARPTKEDELEEDEDLLRAKLLTSLSKNLPKLVDPSIIKTIEEETKNENKSPAPKSKLPEKRIIINLGESDSEGEHEATKNLTKMHIKLSEQIDFQQKLDMFLKSTRMEVENKALPDVIQKPELKTPEKFVAKTVNHLPKTEQIEYKNLVKRMEELQKIKEARQASMNIEKAVVKDTLKPRNTSSVPAQRLGINKLEEQITLSRKRIAEESAKMMKLKEEGMKLSQKYKIVATELKNLATALTLNKKEQRTVQNRLTKIRNQHQRLFHSSINKHSKTNGNFINTNRVLLVTKIQKENNPTKDEVKNPQPQKGLRATVVNDNLKNNSTSSNGRRSVEVDGGNKKIAIMPKGNTIKEVGERNRSETNANPKDERLSVDDLIENKQLDRIVDVTEQKAERRKEFGDYESPLQALIGSNWEADPNAIMCPFEVGGFCKDPDCKYLHPKLPTQ